MNKECPWSTLMKEKHTFYAEDENNMCDVDCFWPGNKKLDWFWLINFDKRLRG